MSENPSSAVDPLHEMSDLLSDDARLKVLLHEFLQNFIEEIPEDAMQLLINLDGVKMAVHDQQLMYDENPKAKKSFQTLTKLLSEAVLELPQENYLTSMFENVTAQDDFSLDDNPFLTILIIHLTIPYAKEIYYLPIKNVCDNYPKWFEDNISTLDKDTFINHALMFETFKEMRDQFENQQDTDDEIVKKKNMESFKDYCTEMYIATCGGINFLPSELFKSNTADNGLLPENVEQ